MIEIIKESYLDTYLKYFGVKKSLFKRNRMIYGVLMFLIGSLIALTLNNIFLWVITPLFFYVGYKILYINMMLQKKKSNALISFVFPEFLQSYMALTSTSGNVYQTLKGSIPYTSEPLKTELKKLVDNIEQDNDRDHYMRFAEYIGSNEAYMVMDMIYQFSEFGIREKAITSLQNYIKNLQENKVDELIEKKMRETEKYGYMPIFISVFMNIGFAGVIVMYYLDDVMKALDVPL